MSTTDRLVSPTLAQLYMAQGHRTRARETVESLLKEDPTQGVALVLRDRLASVIDAKLELQIDREVVLRWWIPTHLHRQLEGPPSLVLCAYDAHGDGAPYYLSGPADGARGELHLPFAFARGSATACLALLSGARREIRILAVSESASW
jgi:hypothetical protein